MARLQGISRNLNAFLDMIAFSEGTIGRGDDGYNKLVNPAKFFDSYASHPSIKVRVRKGLVSTAAGRYQHLSVHWEWYRDGIPLPDFGPESQDRWAIQLIRERKALSLIEAGRIPEAIKRCSNIWASFPGADYNQPEHKLGDLLAKYQEFGGELAPL
jgi:muramidase (phage lysozyme)